MKPVFKSLVAAATMAVVASGAQAQEAVSLQDLLEQVKQNRVSEAKINQQREAEFQSARADKQALLKKAQSDLQAEENRGDRLQQQIGARRIAFADMKADVIAFGIYSPDFRSRNADELAAMRDP